MDLLQSIATHFNAAEWARGPSMTCHRLNGMPLTRLVIHNVGALSQLLSFSTCLKFFENAGSECQWCFLPVQATAARSHDRNPLSIRRNSNEDIISGMAWVARRTSAATASLVVALPLSDKEPSSRATSPLVAPFAAGAQVSNIRSLHLYVPDDVGFAKDKGLVPTAFLDWLLEHTPKLEMVNLEMSSQRLPASYITFQHLRHLLMDARASCQLQSSYLPWKLSQLVIQIGTSLGMSRT